MFTKSCTYKTHGTLRKTSFCTKGYVEIFHIKAIFRQRKSHMGNSCIGNLQSRHMLWCLGYTSKFIFLKNTKISIFGDIPKFLKLIVFGQVLGDFGQISANFATSLVGESMAELG